MTDDKIFCPNVPKELLEKIHCSICSKYLSVFPIHLSASLGSVCGRCSIENVEDAVRNTLYETFVEGFKFPCSNVVHGCVEYFSPSGMKNHENICKYRHMKCPSSQHVPCDWVGPCTQLQDHYESLHPIFLMKQLDFEVNFINNFDENYLLLYGDEIFIFKRKADVNTKVLDCSLMYCGWNSNTTDFCYQLKLTNRSDNSTKIFDKKITTGLDENITRIESKEIDKCLNNPSVIVGTVEITYIEADEEVKKPEKPNLQYDMLDTIECPVCFEYMVPPIFQCLGGHSICGTCKDTVSQCPTCREGIKDTRNFILEKMINYLQYPCKNWENGCSTITVASSIKKHEKFCEFGTYECPMKNYVTCNYKSKLSDLKRHLLTEHHENSLEYDTVHMPVEDEITDDEDGYILKYMDKLFIVHFKIENEMFWWSVQFIGSPESAKQYLCEIDIIDNAHGKNRIYLKGVCGSLTSKEDCFKEMPYFTLTLDQIEHFVTDTLSFQVRVFKE